MSEGEIDVPDAADILIVEDNPGDVRLIKEGIEASALDPTIHGVTNGDEALDFLFQRGDYDAAPRPDLVFLDLNLPRKNGDQVLADLKSTPGRRRIPVIIFTSSKAKDDVCTAYEQHANACLTKPDHATEFIGKTSEIVELWFSLVRPPAGDE